MRIGEIIGSVTLGRCHPNLSGGSFRLATPLTLANLRGEAPATAEPFVVYDQLGAGVGAKIAISEGGEAAQPFRPEIKPIDAYCAAILDSIDMRTRA